MSEQKPTPGTVRAVIEQLNAEERERLVKALAQALLEQVQERRRVDALRRMR